MTEDVLFTRQAHNADRAGFHHDYRLVVGDKAYSWATKKEMPEQGKSIMLWEQPVHTADYALSKKVVIPSGQYGAGVTTLDWVKKGKASFEDGKIVVHTKEGRFLLKKMPNYEDGTGWLFKQLPKEEKMENKYLEKIATTRFVKELLKDTSKEFSNNSLAKDPYLKGVAKGILRDKDKLKDMFKWRNK